MKVCDFYVAEAETKFRSISSFTLLLNCKSSFLAVHPCIHVGAQCSVYRINDAFSVKAGALWDDDRSDSNDTY